MVKVWILVAAAGAIVLVALFGLLRGDGGEAEQDSATPHAIQQE